MTWGKTRGVTTPKSIISVPNHRALYRTSYPNLRATFAGSALKPTDTPSRRAIDDRVMLSHTRQILLLKIHLLVAALKCYAVLVYLPYMHPVWYIMQYDTIPSTRP